MLPNPADLAFFGTVTLVAAWALIVPAKVWEGRKGDALVRRLIQGSLGLGVGAIAAVLRQFLMLNQTSLLQPNGDGVFNAGTIGKIHMLEDGLPTMSGFMMFFGSLFLMRRWWWQADSFRKSRFRISSSLVSLFLGVMLSACLPFPEQLGAHLGLGDFRSCAIVVRLDAAGRSFAGTSPCSGSSDADTGASPGCISSGCCRSKNVVDHGCPTLRGFTSW